MTTYWWYKIDTTRQQLSIFFFFNDTATTEIYTLSLHDALPICIVGVAKSTNNGATFSTPFDASTTASNTTDMLDKEWIAVDRTTSAFKGNVYASWTDFTLSGSFINFSRSTNGGSPFEPPIPLSLQDG